MLFTAICIQHSASARQVGHSLRFETFGVEQGLPQESVMAMLQDRQGFMWFGTQAGLARYDGYRAIVFKKEPGNPHSLVDNFVSALHEDAGGNLWIGTPGGLLRYDSGNRNFKRTAGESQAQLGGVSAGVRAIAEGPVANDAATPSAGLLWIASDSGLLRLDPRTGVSKSWRHKATELGSLSSDDVHALAWDRLGRLWIGTTDGISRMRIDNDLFEHFRLDTPASSDVKHNAIQALLVDASNRLWVGTRAGLELWDLAAEPPSRRRFTTSEGLPEDRVRALLEDHNGNIWIGTERSGLLRWDPEHGRFATYRQSPTDAHSLRDDDVVSLFQDRSGTLWAGTWAGGVSRSDLSGGGFQRYDDFSAAGDSRLSRKIYAIAADAEGNLWLGAVGGGLHRLRPSDGSTISYRRDPSDPNSLPDDIIRAVHVDSVDQVWVGTAAGLARIDPDSRQVWSRHLSDSDSALDIVRAIASGNDGSLWIATEGGLIHYQPQTDQTRLFIHHPSEPSSINPGRVLSVHRDRRGLLWAGTDNGLARMNADGSSFNRFIHDPDQPGSLGHDRVHQIFEDRAGGLWIATAGGLNRVEDPDTANPRFVVNPSHGQLAAEPIGAILEDVQGMLWISTTVGISRLDPFTGHVRNFSASDGMIDGSYLIGSAYADEQGTLYFGGLNGLTAFRPEQIGGNAIAPLLAITELELFNRPVIGSALPDGAELSGPIETATTLRLSHQHSAISLGFAALHFADPQRNRYAYQLQGFDPDWTETDATRRLATYTNLDPGQYRFRVKASNKDGVWNEHGAELEITISPPFWATWWFRTIAVLLILGCAWAIYRQRIAGLTRQRQWLEQQVAARTAEVVAQKEHVEQAHANLAVLGKVGREITATLDEDAVCTTLNRHVHALLDATTFGIYLLDADRAGLSSRLFVEDGQSMPTDHIDLASSVRHASRCARERQELSLDWAPEDVDESLIPGTLNSLSALFAPLTIGDRLLGVMTVQSPRRHAYGEAEQVIFRTLCAYGVIALDNAAVYRQLQQTETMLQRSLTEQRLIFDNIAAAIYFVKDRTIHRCNRGMEEILGYQAGELVGKSTEVLYPSRAAWELHFSVINPLISSGKVAEGERETVRKDGSLAWVSYFGRALDPSDLQQGTIWVAYDISERKRNEAALERVQREQQILFENDMVGVMFTRDRTVVRANRGFEQILGYTQGELEGLSTRAFFESDEAWAAFGRDNFRALESGIATGDVVYVCKDGQRIWVAFHGKAIDPNDLSQGVIWAGVDISERKRNEAALLTANQELQSARDHLLDTQQQLVQREKMAALGTLTAGVAHEINNPTNFADGAVQHLQTEHLRLHEFLRKLAGDDAPPAILQAIAERFERLNEMTETAREGHERIKRIVGDLRQFTRLDEAQHKAIPIAEPIQSTVNLVRTQFDRIRFELDLSCNPRIECQPAKLSQVFMNLIVNACEAIGDCHDGRAGVVRIAISIEGDWVRIDLSDNGAGIEEATLQRVFEPFFTTKAVGAGTGLGLAIVFGIIKDHGGSIEVSSTPQEGTQFCIRLPLGSGNLLSL